MCAAIALLKFQTIVIAGKETLQAFTITPHPHPCSPHPWLPLSLLARYLSICLFWTFRLNEIMHNEVFGVWLSALQGFRCSMAHPFIPFHGSVIFTFCLCIHQVMDIGVVRT